MMLLVKAGRFIPKPRPVYFLRDAIHWVDNDRYLGVNTDKQLPWSTHNRQERKRHTDWERWDLS